MNNLRLIDLVNNERTDKNTIHSYLNLYESLLKNKQNVCKNVIEIGVQWGGSIKLWHDYFPNAIIYGCDIYEESIMWDEIKNNNRIKLFNSTNAYDPLFINKIKDIEFDLALDDGPHTLESMIKFIELYLPLMKDDGILIIEDVQDISWLDNLSFVVPNELKKNIKTYDLRSIKGRYDDIVFVIDKSKNKHIEKHQPVIDNAIESNNLNQNILKPFSNVVNIKHIENINPVDLCLVINTCRSYSRNIEELITQIKLYNNVIPNENILIISGQENENNVDYINGIKYIKVKYSGIHLTSAIYINENIKDFSNINYWAFLPDTIKFGPNFFNLLCSHYSKMKTLNIHSLPFINECIRPTMDMGILHTNHIINITDYLNKIKIVDINQENLLKLKKQLIYNENAFLGFKAICYEPSTKFNYLNINIPPYYFITNSNADILTTIENNIQCVYLTQLDLYKYQRNFNGPDSNIIISL